MNRSSYTYEFAEFIPEVIENGVLYVSVEYATTSHLCMCGCGSKVVAPLTPHDWRMSYDGETVSLWPSIGNWSFPCESHYFLRDGQVDWARKWTDDEIAFGRSVDRENVRRIFDTDAPESAGDGTASRAWFLRRRRRPRFRY